jgi:large subunit ribosomal protein L10
MNREQKTAAVAEIVENIQASEAVLAVDYRGLTVTQAAELRAALRENDATLAVAKNTLTGRAITEVGESAEGLRGFLAGPTALTYVKGDVAATAKAITTFAKANGDLPAFKGGILDGQALSVDEIQAISKLPSRDVLYGQLVGVVAAPITGLARGLNALIGGLAIALAGVQEKKESGEIPSGDARGGSGDDVPAPAEEASAPVAEAQDDAAPSGDAENQADADASADESGASA